MGCRTNGLSNQWAVGLVGRNRTDLYPGNGWHSVTITACHSSYIDAECASCVAGEEDVGSNPSHNGICVSYVYIQMLTHVCGMGLHPNINIRDTDSIGTRSNQRH